MKSRPLTARLMALSGIAALGSACLPQAFAGTWTYPDEISVAEAYNDIFFTSYDTTTQEGLAALVADHGGAMQFAWTTATVKTVTFLLMETSSTASVGILVDGEYIVLQDPGPWTPPSRGWFDDPLSSPDWAGGTIDMASLLTSHGHAANASFMFVVGGVVMDDSNTYRLEDNNTNGGFLLAYNEGGLMSGDGDANEPVLYINAPTTLPGTCEGLRPTVVGTPKRDIISGVPGPAVIMTLGDNDVIYGTADNDVICGGDGSDVIKAMGGDDKVFGGAGNDRVFGGDGNDEIHGGGQNDTLIGEAGNDVIYGDAGEDTLLGYGGADELHGGTGGDTLKGGAGDDHMYGDEGDDTMVGEDGNDVMEGGDGADKIVGMDGNDTLKGDAGDDSIYGGAGDDTVDGGAGDDVCDGGYDTDAATNCETATNFETLF